MVLSVRPPPRLANRGDEVARHRAAHDLVDEREPGTALSRGNVDLHIRKLPVAAGLALQPTMLVHRAPDRLLKCHGRLMRHHLNP